jgi:hypothetical protein
VTKEQTAEKDAIAHLVIVRALMPVESPRRGPVLEAVRHLIEADTLVPGVLHAFLRGSKEGATE